MSGRHLASAVLGSTLFLAGIAVASANDSAVSFAIEMDAAMERMMQNMAIEPTGDVDRDFLAMMVPHHQGAIDMAVAELKFGKNDRLKRIAQEIIVEQQQEIDAMQRAVNEVDGQSPFAAEGQLPPKPLKH